jgi:HNH endonuclease
MPTRRKSTGKRLRFEVFKRDHFTCQYCGAQPPDIVLVADHITPVADGGATTIDNLLAACEPCNQGKADRSLAARTIRPDADLLYLEVQQEIAELRRYQQAKAARDAEIAKVVVLLQDEWAAVSDLEWVPAEALLRSLLTKHAPEIAEAAIQDVASKMQGGYVSTEGDRWIPYLFTVARNLAHEYEDGYGA